MLRTLVQNFLMVAAVLMVVVSCRSLVKTTQQKPSQSPSKLPGPGEDNKRVPEYYVHRDIKTTYFYIGQHDVTRSGVLDNGSSAWTEHWIESYGGVDHPDKRNGYFPADFYPEENPFYCALPYNDIQHQDHKQQVLEIIPWAKKINHSYVFTPISYCKNRWIRIIYRGKVCYAQWEDVGPFEVDDWEYVFGKKRPKNKRNGGVGLDISPACFQYLGMEDNDYTSWKFVDFKDVPDGPWLEVVTTSPPTW
ncbi:MAG: hypothetical protein ACOC7U_03800 [Spirochaetota bacterium]